MSTTTNCVFCGGQVEEQAISCPHCGGPLKKGPAPGAPPSTMRSGSHCPNCSAAVGAGDIVCVQCGTNLLTGEKVMEKKPAETRKWDGGTKALKSIGIGLAAIALFVGATLLILYLLRDPVGEARRQARSGNLSEASETLLSYLQRTPKDEEAQFLLGQIYWQGQQYDRAFEVFESVARQSGPRDRDAALLAVLAAERAPAAEGKKRQAALLRALVQQRYPNDGELLTLLALAQGIEGEYGGQREALEEAVRLGGEVSPVLPGLASALNNDMDGAERALAQAASKQPENDVVLTALGFIRANQGQEEAAMTALEQALDAQPELAGLVKLQLGLLHMRQGNPAKALPLLTAAKSERPEDERAAFFLALCLQENKLLEEALSAFEPTASGTGPMAGAASLQMALIYLEQNNTDRAGAFARRASEAGVNTARQATIQGRVFAFQGETGQAEQAYRRAISMEADYPAARLELGLLLINRGVVDAGLQELTRYLELAQADPSQYRANEIEVLVTQIQQTR